MKKNKPSWYNQRKITRFGLIGIVILLAVAILYFLNEKNFHFKADSVAVNVGVDSKRNINEINAGDQYLTKAELLKLFDKNKDGVATVSEFQAKARSIDWKKEFTFNQAGGPCLTIKLINREPTSQIVAFLDLFDKAAIYLQTTGMSLRLPKSIILGNNGAGNYASIDTWNLSDPSSSDVVVSKTIQQALPFQNSTLSYTQMEAYSNYYLWKYNNSPVTRDYQYNSSFETLTGNDITYAYTVYNKSRKTQADTDALNQIISNVANNNRAIAQAIWEIQLAPSIVISAVKNTSGVSTQSTTNGKQVLTALNTADQTLTGGKNVAKMLQKSKLPLPNITLTLRANLIAIYLLNADMQNTILALTLCHRVDFS